MKINENQNAIVTARGRSSERGGVNAVPLVSALPSWNVREILMIEPIARKSKHAAVTARTYLVVPSLAEIHLWNSREKKERRERACRVARLEEKSLIETRDIRGKY